MEHWQVGTVVLIIVLGTGAPIMLCELLPRRGPGPSPKWQRLCTPGQGRSGCLAQGALSGIKQTEALKQGSADTY